ncbi:MAG: hypothetical protein ACOYOS_25260 [Syntrophales bacterium]
MYKEVSVPLDGSDFVERARVMSKRFMELNTEFLYVTIGKRKTGKSTAEEKQRIAQPIMARLVDNR